MWQDVLCLLLFVHLGCVALVVCVCVCVCVCVTLGVWHCYFPKDLRCESDGGGEFREGLSVG